MNHEQAFALIAQVLPDAPALGRSLVQTIGWLESNYGQGWKGDGAGSHNWGAITGTYHGSYFEYGDSRPNAADPAHPIKYTTKFRKYPSDAAGITDLWQLLNQRYRSAVDAALQGDWRGVSQALYDQHYYTGTSTNPQTNVDRHAGRVAKIQEAIAHLYPVATPFPAEESPTNPEKKTPGA